jgi:CheY-like chemotaxis protein
VVLVIDDEETIRRTAKAILEKRGMHVFLAETGRAGVEAFRRLADRVALVLLDLTMPLMGGNEVLREIRAVRRDVPVLMSSGYDEAEAMHRITGGEVTGFIQKPYTAAQLFEKVRQALGQTVDQ